MITIRTPFRVSFCGGGSDLPSFYEQYGGCVLSTTIKKYMYLSLHSYFYQDYIRLKYSKTETVKSFDEIEHRIFKQCLSDFNVKGIEISSIADVPAGTGLGSSSSFTVALLHLLHTYKGEYVSKYKLAKDACDVEVGRLKEPIGKQDQYAAAFGGLNFYQFLPNGFVNVEPIVMKKDSYAGLEKNLLMFFTGNVRSASEILLKQSDNMKDAEKAKVQSRICDMARELKEELQKNNIGSMGELLHKSWLLKRELSSGITNPYIDELYDKAISAGAAGGKLLGAGGGGFLLFYVTDEHKKAVREALNELPEMDFEFDNTGSSIIFIDR